ncbi:MAG: hypothetical protein JHC95_16645 [Solirubrobacteraceae bacterium]|nr:hypothetical protein [Solirubrobacteraceae bacterium]
MHSAPPDHERHAPDDLPRTPEQWSTDLAERLDDHVSDLVDVAEALLEFVDAGAGDPDDLVVRRARRMIDTSVQGLGAIGAQLWVGPQ